MAGGGGPPERSTTTNRLDPALAKILKTSGLGISRQINALLPQLGRLSQFQPQQIPGMTADEQRLLGNLQGSIDPYGMTRQGQQAGELYQSQMNLPGGLTPDQVQAQQFYQGQLGPIGQSPLMDAWRRGGLQETLQSSALQGLGAGGMAETVANAADREAMQIAAMQNQAAGSLAGLGAQGFGQQSQAAGSFAGLGQEGLGNLGSIFQASSLPREIEAQRGEAQTNEIARLQNWLQQISSAPFGALAGQTGSSQTINQGGGGK